MVQQLDTSLEGRLAEVESQLRALRATNLTDLASVTNAEGAAVPLSQLAFGMVTAADLALTEIDAGVPGGPGGLGWYYGTPQLDVRVSGGGLLVLTAAAVHAQGNKAGMFQSYRLLGPGDAAGEGLGAVPVGPAYDRSVSVFDPGYGQGTDVGAGSFGVHTGLAPGWYRVQSAYALSYSAGSATFGSATNRRIAALPF